MNPKGLSVKDICELRLGCVEAIAVTASKVGLTSGEMIDVAGKVYEFVIETTGKDLEGQAQAPAKR